MEYDKIVQESKDTIEQFRSKHPNGVVIIWGATATGKTGLSVRLSKYFDIEVISSDSRQIFREMSVGTDKVTADITEQVPHHIIDQVDPTQHYTAGQRKKDAIDAIQDIQNRGKLAMVVGGTGLYIDTLYKNYTLPECAPNYDFRTQLEAEESNHPGILHKKLKEIDPIEAEKHHPNSTRYIIRALEIYHETGKTKTETCKEQPVDFPLLMIGLRREKEATDQLINQRVLSMVDSGLIQETQALLDKGYDKNLQSMQGIGYKECIQFLEEIISKEEMVRDIQLATQRLAKKQRTRFRRYINDAQNHPKENVQYKVFQL